MSGKVVVFTPRSSKAYWNLQMGSPNGTVAVPVADLRSAYDIHDPVHEFVMPEPLVAAAAALAAPTATATPAAAPAQPVAGAPVGTRPTEPAPSAAPAPAPASPAPKHPEWLIREAAELGLPAMFAERLETGELTQYVVGEMRKVRDNARSNQVAAAVTAQPAPRPASPQSTPQATQPGQQAVPSPGAFDWGIYDDVDDMGRPVKKQFTDEDISPALVFHIKKLAARTEMLENHLTAMAQQASAAGQSQVDKQFDAAFNKLGGVFGTGSALALQGKPELANRLLVYNAVKAMFSSLPAAVREQMGIEKAVNTFAKSMFNVEPAAAAANGAPTPEQFRTGTLGQPTQRQGSDSPHGRDKAIDDANRWWKENQASGAIPAGGGTTMEEFFPM